VIFTGRNLQMVRYGMQLAIDELHNQIGTCPDVFTYAEEIEEIEAQKRRFERLLARIDRRIKEKGLT
jgi:hypothetical protein